MARTNAWQCVTGFLVVVFAIERFATSLFYGHFGVTLEEVGIGYGESLLEGVVLFLLLWVALNAFILLPAIMAILHGWSHLRGFALGFWDAAKEQPRAMLFYAAHRLSAIALIIIVIVFRNELDAWILGLALGGALVALVAIGVLLRNPKARAAATWPVIFRRSLIATSAIALLLLATFLAAAFYWAVRDSRAAAKGLEIGGFPSISWRAQPVTAHALHQDTAPTIVAELEGHCVMYLGQANGISVLFDVHEQHTLRLPTSGIVLRTPARSSPQQPCAARR